MNRELVYDETLGRIWLEMIERFRIAFTAIGKRESRNDVFLIKQVQWE